MGKTTNKNRANLTIIIFVVLTSVVIFGLLVAAGAFLQPNEPINITLEQNKPFLLRCPPRAYSNRVTYDWIVQSTQTSIANNRSFAPRILMEPTGDLLFSFVNGSELSPVQCRTRNLFRRYVVGPPMYLRTVIPGTSGAAFLYRSDICRIFTNIWLILLPHSRSAFGSGLLTA